MFWKKDTTKYKIEGISCSSCRQTILLDLEDAGFAGLEINDNNELILPKKLIAKIPTIKKAVDSSKKYKLIIAK